MDKEEIKKIELQNELFRKVNEMTETISNINSHLVKLQSDIRSLTWTYLAEELPF